MKLAFLLWLASVIPQPLADQTCLAATVYLEARGEPLLGQLAIAEVALRRREQGRWGDNLCKVLTARGQFALSMTNENYRINNMESWRRAWSVAGVAIDMWTLPEPLRMAIVPRADHFYASSISAPDWAKGDPLAVIGDHNFYAAN